MTGPPPAVAAIRLAVRRSLADLRCRDPAALVLVAASGGADSTALAAAVAFEAPRAGIRAGLLTVDHGWSRDSGSRAAAVAAWATELGLDPSEVLAAPAPRSEGAARDARREVLFAAAARLGADALLLGHTLDDQAETVLLRLARGSGSRSLAGMPARSGLLRRPLLDVRRGATTTACSDAGLPVWDDPTNADPSFLRARVRVELLPLLTDVLGPGAVPALARSADLLRADADALEAAASTVLSGDDALAVNRLQTLEPAIRSRVLRAAALDAGCPATDLTARHVAAVDALLTRWHGQGPLSLPGGVSARRRGGRIEFDTGGTQQQRRGSPDG